MPKRRKSAKKAAALAAAFFYVRITIFAASHTAHAAKQG